MEEGRRAGGEKGGEEETTQRREKNRDPCALQRNQDSKRSGNLRELQTITAHYGQRRSRRLKLRSLRAHALWGHPERRKMIPEASGSVGEWQPQVSCIDKNYTKDPERARRERAHRTAADIPQEPSSNSSFEVQTSSFY